MNVKKWTHMLGNHPMKSRQFALRMRPQVLFFSWPRFPGAPVLFPMKYGFADDRLWIRSRNNEGVLFYTNFREYSEALWKEKFSLKEILATWKQVIMCFLVGHRLGALVV